MYSSQKTTCTLQFNIEYCIVLAKPRLYHRFASKDKHGYKTRQKNKGGWGSILINEVTFKLCSSDVPFFKQRYRINSMLFFLERALWAGHVHQFSDL